MAGLFGLFAGSGDRGSKPIYTLDHLQVLHNRLQNIKEDEQNRDQVVEVIRQITEAVLWGEQTGHDNSFFDFFCEKSILADFVRVLGRPNVPRTVKVQLLQTLSMLIQNIRRDTSLYYLFSSNHINQLISTQFDWNDEEILSYYISFLKSLALRLNKETIKFFFNEHTRQFPLYTEAVRFFRHHDQMVRTTVRTLTLQVYSVDDPAMRRFVLDHSAHGYFQNISVHLRRLWTKLDVTVSRAAASTGEQALVRAVQNATEQQQDLVMYIFDVLGLGITELSEVLVQNVLEQACYPALLASLLLSDVEPPSSIPPDATIDGSGLEVAIWAPAASSSSSGESLASFAASSRELQDESGEIEAPEASIRYLLVGMLEGCRDDCVLLVAGLLRAALSSSSILPQALLVEAGLLPSGAEIDNSAKKRHPLEALLLAVRALEQHTSLRIVVIQGLCRLALDLASGPQARSCWPES
ncbi:unnamed protein product [Polarella glacialis]|uniref:FPL domain-containing protein n=1 Tax=Polarella glacialis TaxID=89957 RepID=A0A813JNR7_POLGL|nr:unnamed protein product [Polarella glacialis]